MLVISYFRQIRICPYVIALQFLQCPGKNSNCFNSNISVHVQSSYFQSEIFENSIFSVDELLFNSEIYKLRYYLKNRKFFEDFYIPNLLLFDAALEQKA